MYTETDEVCSNAGSCGCFLADSTHCNQHVKQQCWIESKVCFLSHGNENLASPYQLYVCCCLRSSQQQITTQISLFSSLSLGNRLRLSFLCCFGSRRSCWMYSYSVNFMQCLTQRGSKLKSKKSNHVPWCGANQKQSCGRKIARHVHRNWTLFLWFCVSEIIIFSFWSILPPGADMLWLVINRTYSISGHDVSPCKKLKINEKSFLFPSPPKLSISRDV